MNKRIQKQFYLSSDTKKYLIDTRIEDIVAETKQSSSIVIEEILIAGLLPHHEEAKRIVMDYLYRPEADTIMRTLSELYILNSASDDWEAAYSNFKPIVEFHYKVSVNKKLSIDADDWDDLLYHLHAIVDRIEGAIPLCIETYDRKLFGHYCDDAKHIVSLAETKASSKLRISDFISIILNCWPIIGTWSKTFRCLAFLSSIGKCDNNPHIRYELYKLIDSVSAGWDNTNQCDDELPPRLETTAGTSIQFHYIESKRYANNSTEVYANGALVGVLSPVLPNSDWLIWMPDINNTYTKFQFRHPESFVAVARELQRYKTEQGYKYLVIYAYNHGFVTEIDPQLLKQIGFVNLPNTDPTSMFLQ